MDLFDLDSYFGSHVPIHTRSHSLLRHASCAYAANQLGRVKGTKAPVGRNYSRPASIEIHEDVSVDWEWVGAYHYDQSIALLRDSMQQDQDESRSVHQPQAMVLLRSDEVIAATAILCGYESMGATGAAWSRHLNGIKSLLEIAEGSMMPLEMPVLDTIFSSQRRNPSRAWKATFWNFARQDYVAACKLFWVHPRPNHQLMGYSHQ